MTKESGQGESRAEKGDESKGERWDRAKLQEEKGRGKAEKDKRILERGGRTGGKRTERVGGGGQERRRKVRGREKRMETRWRGGEGKTRKREEEKKREDKRGG